MGANPIVLQGARISSRQDCGASGAQIGGLDRNLQGLEEGFRVFAAGHLGWEWESYRCHRVLNNFALNLKP